MARTNGIYLALAAICLAVLCDVSLAQSSTTDASSTSSTTAAPVLPAYCQNATAMTVNGTKLLGTWYEAARKPVGGAVNTEQCVQMIIGSDTKTVWAAITYSVDPNSLWVNTTINNTVVVDGGSGSEVFLAEFNVSSNGMLATYKILETDYNSYALICGYQVAEDTSSTTVTPSSTSTSTVSSTSSTTTVSTTTNEPTSTTTISPEVIVKNGAFILTRDRQIADTTLTGLITNAVVSFYDFKNITAVTQSSECWTSGASTTVPMLTLIMAVAYTLLKLVQ